MGISCWAAHKAVWSPRKVAIRFRGKDLDYKDFEGQIGAFSGYLRDRLNIHEGDRVAFLGGNSPAILTILFSCARIGAIFVPLNSRLSAPQLTSMLANADPLVLFYGEAFEEVARTLSAALQDMELRCLTDTKENRRGKAIAIPDLVGTETLVECDPNRNQNIPVLIAYTSGTTGTPKGAVFTQDALTFTAINGNNTYNMRGKDNVLTYLPMFHVGGLLIHTLPAIHIGATITIQDGFDAGNILNEINENSVTLLLAPPVFSKSICTHDAWSETDLSSLRGVGIGSTFVPREVIQAWLDRGVPTHQNYGLTEGVQILAVPPSLLREKAASAGTSMLYTQARVVGPELTPLPPHENGEIVLRGRSLFSGYWRNKEATAAAFSKGWFHTGDVAYRDDDGYFHIVDRIKNLVIVGSSNVYPADIERVLNSFPGVMEAAVVGVPDPETGEALCACLRVSSLYTGDPASIAKHCSTELADYQLPKYVTVFDDFPRTSLGKVQKVALRALCLEGLSAIREQVSSARTQHD